MEKVTVGSPGSGKIIGPEGSSPSGSLITYEPVGELSPDVALASEKGVFPEFVLDGLAVPGVLELLPIPEGEGFPVGVCLFPALCDAETESDGVSPDGVFFLLAHAAIQNASMQQITIAAICFFIFPFPL